MNDGPLIDERVARLLAWHEWDDYGRAARIAHLLGFRYLSWLYLFEQGVRYAL